MIPKFKIDLSPGGTVPLDALALLCALPQDDGYQPERPLRPPLGIYNTSLARVCSRVTKCCHRLERYFRTSTRIDALQDQQDLRGEILDYVELSLYAAAEHVDDLKLIAKGFFPDPQSYRSSEAARALGRGIKRHKKLISASTNAIKHNQARIRLYSLELDHAGIAFCLHGFFVEGVHEGVLGPNKIFHSENRQIFSITSLMWEVICFLLHTSRCLALFLHEVTEISPDGRASNCEAFSQCAVAAARLPLYSFDEDHPFSEARISICGGKGDLRELDSDIYGSLSNGWKLSDDLRLGGDKCEYLGDGVSTQFDLVKPSKIELKRWS